jgi:hypothetical protein
LPQAFAAFEGGAKGVVEKKTSAQRKDEEIQSPADFFVGQERSGYQGYTIERRLRKVLLDPGGYGNSAGLWIDVAYINLRNENKFVKAFDADVYFGAGNSADFGFFPFLGDGNKQLFISQDIARGGCQWVVSLSPRFRVIFDGQDWSVGREATDLYTVDLDHDGVKEIVAPITDFYVLHDKMGMAAIPLPDIIFKYDQMKRKYLPANPIFKQHALKNLVQVAELEKSVPNNELHVSEVLSNLLTYIYAGEEKQGWHFYDHNYRLDDKEEIRSRVKKILREQPVYNLIYRREKRKSQVRFG